MSPIVPVNLPLYVELGACAASSIILIFLSFVISFDEFILAFFLSSQDQTLPLYMWGQLRFPKKLPHVLALGAVIIVATSIIVMLSYWLRNLGSPSDKKSNIGGI